MIADFRLALGFLTRIPVSLPAELAPDALARSMRLFPLIGGIIGAALGGLYLLELKILPGWPSALLAIAFGLLLTGALHEDGLADCADGFGGGRGKEGKLAIMRDSRIGAYGTLALILSVGLRASALVGLPRPAAALIVAHSLSRAALPGVMMALPAASAVGLAAGAGKPSRVTFWICLALAAVIGAPLFRTQFPLLLAIAAGTATIVALLARRQIGGYSGDVLGATQQSVEIAVLLSVLAFA